MKKLLALFIFSMIMFSCSTSNVMRDPNQVENLLKSKTWLLQDEKGTVMSYNGQAVNIEFREDNGLQVAGFAGCNRFFTNVNLQKESIKFGNIGSTMMACPEMENEQMFLDLLSQANAYELSGNEFKLFQNKILLLKFKSN